MAATGTARTSMLRAWPPRLPNNDLLALDEALTKLAAEDSLKAQLVQLRRRVVLHPALTL
jgi:hypothetical protein